MSIFGPIISSDQVEDAIRNTLRDWFPTYLREYELQAGIPANSLPEPRAYIVTNDVEKEPEDQMPAILVVSPGLVEEPMPDGEGLYRAPFGVAVAVFTSASDRESTEDLVRQYVAMARAIMLHKQTYGGIGDGTRWVDESYAELTFDDERTIGAGQAVFVVEVAGVVRRYGGPPRPIEPDPDTQPGSNWPTVDEVIVDEEILEEV